MTAISVLMDRHLAVLHTAKALPCFPQFQPNILNLLVMPRNVLKSTSRLR